MSAQIPINTIKNSCIVNNANIAVQNVPNPQGTLTPLDASNNWWGMPVGASDQSRAGGDWVGWNITNQPHLTTIPQNCDLSDANWIPFSEQELQNAILSQLPYVGALDFALLDMQKGYGAKFTLVAKPEYGGQRGEAYISIAPSDDGTWMMLMLDFSRLPTTTASDNLSQIATCSLMPLFLNSLQQVQSRFTQPSQLIEQMVVMDSALMILFTAPTEITPDPSPSLVMNYDSSCLPIPMTPTPAPTPVSPQDEDESGLQVNIPPLEEGVGLMENGLELLETEQEPEEIIQERMLFQVTYPAPSENHGIYSANPSGAGSDVQLLTPNFGFIHENEVALSPDGRYIAFIGQSSGLSEQVRIFVMRSDGSGLRALSETGDYYRYIGWANETGDSQIITYSIGANNITYAVDKDESISTSVVLIPDGIRPKWNLSNTRVVYSTITTENDVTTTGLYWAEIDPATYQIIPETTRLIDESTDGIPKYEWASQGVAVLYEIDNELWLYKGTPALLIEYLSSQEWMATQQGHHFVMIKTRSFSGGYYLSISYNLDIIQRFIINGYTLQQAHPIEATDVWGAYGNMHHPFLSPYRNSNTNDQDIFFMQCSILGGPYFCQNAPLHILDANSFTPRRVFENTPVQGSKVIAWQDFRLPPPSQTIECSDPNDFSKLTEENTDLADRKACWLRYKEIIYLTIYHEFSMDKKLVFTPKTISDTTSFDITQYEYAGLVGDMGLDPRHITNAELIPLQAYDSPYNPYYTFARALLNGMRSIVNPDALNYPTQIPEPLNTYGNPMLYFSNNYLYAVAGVTYQGERWVDNWLVSCTERENVDIKMNGTTHTVPICKNFCAGEFISQPLQSGDNFPVCNSEEWFASQLQANKWAYSIIMPEVEDAIRDMIYRPDNEPVWLSAIYSVVPANRAPLELGDTMVATVDGVGNFLNSSGYSCFGETKLGNIGQTYIFNTPLGYLWDLTWKYYPSTCNPSNPNYQVFYSEDIWDSVQGGVAHISSYPGSCENVNETLPQAYMRHLRETYGDNYATSTFTRILNGDDIGLLIDTQVRFGMANRSVRMPVLGLEFYTEFPEAETPTPLPPTYRISGIVWYTYNFNIPKETTIAGFAEQPTLSTIPTTAFEFVVYDANQDIIEPLDENDCP